MTTPTMSYKDAGVDINAGNELVEHIKPIANKTKRAEVLAGLGGFGALFEIPLDRYKQPVLVSTTDGVGTKLKLAMTLKKHDTIGIDLVAMCVNDIIVQGAEPLFFLDYYATGHLTLSVAKEVLQGIGTGCELAGAALVGGETAEMPGMYHGEDYDLAGFCVGVVEKNKIINGSHIQPGDILLGLASSGVHSNGFSLVRKIIEVTETSLNMPFNNSTLGEVLLTPTRIYVKSILALLQKIPVKAIAHITGGGLLENIPRVLPNNTIAFIQKTAWQRSEIFQWLQTKGNVADQEMLRTFNCGIGMVICISKDVAKNAIEILTKQGETVWQIGEIKSGLDTKPHVEFV